MATAGGALNRKSLRTAGWPRLDRPCFPGLLRHLLRLPLAAFLLLAALSGAHAQQAIAVATRVDSVRTMAHPLDEGRAMHRFGRHEQIRLYFVIDAEIDSATTLVGNKRFAVIGGRGRGHSTKWSDGVRSFAEWHYFDIVPRRRGRLTVPTVTLYSGGVAHETDPLQLTIGR